jgi:hypothetical protein
MIKDNQEYKAELDRITKEKIEPNWKKKIRLINKITTIFEMYSVSYIAVNVSNMNAVLCAMLW